VDDLKDAIKKKAELNGAAFHLHITETIGGDILGPGRNKTYQI
jgi:hypothetical protein